MKPTSYRGTPWRAGNLHQSARPVLPYQGRVGHQVAHRIAPGQDRDAQDLRAVDGP